MSRPQVRPPYRSYGKNDVEFLPIFIDIDEAQARGDKHFITNYCKEKPINRKSLYNKWKRWRDANRPAIHENGVVDGLSSARGGNNRALSLEDENEFADHIRSEHNIFPSQATMYNY